jgi:hypothetical protein
MERRSRARKVVDLIDLNVEREGHVMPDHFKVGMQQEVLNIILGSGEVIVDAQDLRAVGDQPITEMRPKESSSPCNKNAFA